MLRRIIIDTDPGQDDAFAILFALGAPDALEVVGITTVGGNAPLALTSQNALKVVELAGRPDVPVYAGCPGPMVRPLKTAEYVHGETGLDGADLPEPVTPLQAEHAVNYLVRAIMDAPEGDLTVCTLGPMTNLAMAMTMEPRIIPRLREVVLMGGGFFEGGNITPAAEFNIYVDPEAADIVLRCGRPVTVIPLDCTHKALTTRARVERFRALGTRVGEVVASWLDFFERFDVEKYGSEGGPLHDPCVIAYLLKPELFHGRLCNVEVETRSELTRGMTVADWWGVTKRPRNATWVRDLDAEGYFALLIERIGKLHAQPSNNA